MIECYLVVASRIRQELTDLERVVSRAEQAMGLARNSTEHDLYLDSVALNLHDFYGGLERIFRHIATGVDQSLPGGPEWHRAHRTATLRLFFGTGVTGKIKTKRRTQLS
ncbi:MAG: hypothetical protein KGZ60_13685 [Truepera sp.]|nr:hypothetical protein [Truepera sp.]MBS3968047.1 hypothetical protein [Truepera sp.]MBS3968304.1 hypothetical protein [Truepera sp.]